MKRKMPERPTQSSAKATNLWLSVVVALGALLPACALGARVQWSQNGHYYEVVSAPSGITWEAASSAATVAGGYLATLTSTEENSFVYELTLPVPGVWYSSAEWMIGPWLGGTDAVTEGTWQWVTGEPWGDASWLGGQPDNWQNEDHLAFWGKYTVSPTWNDTAGSVQLRGYVVEYVPEPATFSLFGLGALSLLAARRRKDLILRAVCAGSVS